MNKEKVEKIVKEVENFSIEELEYYDELMTKSNRKLLEGLINLLNIYHPLDF